MVMANNVYQIFFLYLDMLNTYEPAHDIMELTTWATSEGSGEPALPRSLARAFALRTHEVWK